MGKPMDDRTISISISGDEEEFIAGQLAAGHFADEKELLHASLAALEREAKVREFRQLIAAGDADIVAGRSMVFSDSAEFTQYVIGDAEALRSELASSEASGTSARQIPDIVAGVKAKLRANGSL